MVRRQRSGKLGCALKSRRRVAREASSDDFRQGEGKLGTKVSDRPVSSVADRFEDQRFGIARGTAFCQSVSRRVAASQVALTSAGRILMLAPVI